MMNRKLFSSLLPLSAALLSAVSPSVSFASMGAAPIMIAQASFVPDNSFLVAQNSTTTRRTQTTTRRTRKTTTRSTVKPKTTSTTTTTRSTSPAASSSASSSARPGARRSVDSNFARANQLAKSGQYQEASKLLFQMSRTASYEKNSAQIKYVLGLMLFEMKLNQAAAFVFYDLIRQETKSNPKSKYIRQSLEKLAVAADSLDSDVLLRYAIKQVDENQFPAANRDMLYFRTGEVRMSEKQFVEAARQFSRVRSNSFLFARARYNMGLALAEGGELEKAQATFEDLAERTKSLGVTNADRVNSLMGRARVLYQRQQFGAALEAYRDVPRDTEQWHDALFESSWAMLRDGRFRSALSNFHSLHSPYYEDHFQPESLLLRAIVYLYICRYDEMDKVLNLFEKVYKPVHRDIQNVLAGTSDSLTYYRELARVNDSFDAIRANRVGRRGFQLPFSVARQILQEGDVRRTFHYLKNLEDEKKRMESLPIGWKSTGIGIYSRKIVDKRLEATRILAGKQIRRHLVLMDGELRDLFEQNGFLRFEMLNSKRETLRKEIQGKGLTKVDEQTSRDYYIQNGYEYWPFKGEYWLDEIGNYHYVGVKACE